MCNIRDQRLWSSPKALAVERRPALPPEREGSMHDISKLASPSSPADGADRPMTASNVDDAKETVSPTSGGGASKLDAAPKDRHCIGRQDRRGGIDSRSRLPNDR